MSSTRQRVHLPHPYPHYELVDVPELGGKAMLFYRGWASSMSSDAAIFGRHRFARGNTTFHTPEHLFQAYKATNLEDFEAVRRSGNPLQAKARGKSIVLRPDWEEVKYDTMFYAHLLKYTQQGGMRGKLLQYPDAVTLAEDSDEDYEWGCRDADGGWTGKNLLGKVLMGVRTELAVRIGR